jgi:hypothetical protein
MKATLEFNLPKEQNEHRLAIHGSDWYSVVWGISQRLRSWQRHGHTIPDADGAIAAMQDFLQQEMSATGVSLEDVS